MKNLLLVTDSFPPGFAPRMGYLVKFLKETGNWNVDVIAHELGDTSHSETFQHLCGYARNVWRYKGDDGIHGTSPKKAVQQMFQRQMTVRAFLQCFVSRISYALIGLGVGFDAREKIRSAVRENKYDLVLGSDGSGCVSGMAKYAAKCAGVPYVLDFRDLFESRQFKVTVFSNRREWCRRKRRDFCARRAQAIITVIDQYVGFLKVRNQNVTLIRNGYDPEVFQEVAPVKVDRFQLTYIGSVYDVPLWKPLNEGIKIFLKELHGDESRNVSFDFWMTPQTYEKRVLPHWCEELTPFMHFHTPVPQTELLAIFKSASVALRLGQNVLGRFEAITTKLYEYFAVNRPILDVAYRYEGEAERLINDLHAGKIAVTSQDVAEFLCEKYAEWKNNGFVRGTTPSGAAAQYSRRSQSVEFEKVLTGILSMNKKSAWA